MKAWTDYPIVELGDTPGMRAPIRMCFVQSYDGDKYCEVIVAGHHVDIKSGYLYSEAGRYGEVPQIDVMNLGAAVAIGANFPAGEAMKGVEGE